MVCYSGQRHDDDFGEWIILENSDDLTEVVKTGDVLTVRVRTREPERGTTAAPSDHSVSEPQLAKQLEQEELPTSAAPALAPVPTPARPLSKKEERAQKKAQEKRRKEEEKATKKAARKKKS